MEILKIQLHLDIGDTKDIHPKNKQEVGRRLALLARANTYSEDIVCNGPIYKSYNIEGDKIRITFSNQGKKLVCKDAALKGFEIAGADKKFYFANALIQGDNVVVYAENVPNPIAVRYAWADNPICNLYNDENLPASPIRTDDWQGVTLNKK